MKGASTICRADNEIGMTISKYL